MQLWKGAGLTASALLMAAAMQGGSSRAQDAGAISVAEQAAATEAAMTPAERLILVSGIMAIPDGPQGKDLPDDAVPGAGYVEGIPRLGIPALKETDAGLGVSWALGARGAEGSTALPSGMSLAATWDPELAYRAGQMIGGEARAMGFNVLLAGGLNLIRDPRAGRNFEYLSEDPLLSGLIAGESIAGIQSNHILSTIKHFAFANQETGRHFADVRISENYARESELLAFKIAIERGKPASVMCAYNKVNGHYTCGSDWLLNQVLKRDWQYKGFVMSDWGAVYDVDFALKGLDHQSAGELDKERFFGAPLTEKIASDPRYANRLRDMNRRILHAILANGLDKHPVQPGGVIDKAANAAIAEEVSRQGIVLLRNRDDILPLAGRAKKIAVIGGFADTGVLSGGGSSQVHLDGGPAATIPGGGKGLFNGWEHYQRATPPLAAIRARAGEDVEVVFRSGSYISEAVEQAHKADLVIVFANQWMTEGRDLPDLSLPRGQDQLIEAVASANPNTIVVLQTGGAVLMPWLEKTAAVLEAWYPGGRGGEAVAAVLFGDVNPSGRLPVTFPRGVDQLPRPKIDGWDIANPDLNGKALPGQKITINYDIEGSDLGYRWNSRQNLSALFPFGFGLSYSTFAMKDLRIENDMASFTVANTGQRAGATVAQLYLQSRNGVTGQRLVGFKKVTLEPGQSRNVTVAIDPRLLADWQGGSWKIPAGDYSFALGDHAESMGEAIKIRLSARTWRDR